MPGEPQGPGYTAPPSIISTVEGERVRSVEDFLSRRIKTRLYRTTNQSSPPGVAVDVSWQAESYDTGGLWTSGTTLIVPPGAEGDYLILAQVQFNPTSDGVFWRSELGIMIGGSYKAISGGNEFVSAAVDHTCLAGETIKLVTSVGTSFTLAQTIKGGANSTYISVRRLV